MILQEFWFLKDSRKNTGNNYPTFANGVDKEDVANQKKSFQYLCDLENPFKETTEDDMNDETFAEVLVLIRVAVDCFHDLYIAD